MPKPNKRRNPKAVKAGKKARRKGGNFERKIRRIMERRFPGAVVYRTQQSERAHNSDITIEGGPAFLSRIWWELTDGASVNPAKKLEQAEKDSKRVLAETGVPKVPVVVFHRIRELKIWVYARLDQLWEILSPLTFPPSYVGAMRVTIELEEFVSMLVDHSCARFEMKRTN
jgi:hypothetical protein